MFWTKRNTNERYIELGRVPCPRSEGDVELDACLGCEHMEEVHSDGDTPFVRCKPAKRYAFPA